MYSGAISRHIKNAIKIQNATTKTTTHTLHTRNEHTLIRRPFNEPPTQQHQYNNRLSRRNMLTNARKDKAQRTLLSSALDVSLRQSRAHGLTSHNNQLVLRHSLLLSMYTFLGSRTPLSDAPKWGSANLWGVRVLYIRAIAQCLIIEVIFVS